MSDADRSAKDLLNRATNTVDDFREGQRVMHAHDSRIPYGRLGTVLGEARREFSDGVRRLEVEYDDWPCPDEPGSTSWYSRPTSIVPAVED